MIRHDFWSCREANRGRRVAIFDFDGVIVDSVDIKGAVFYSMYERHGQEFAERVLAHHKANGGINRREKFEEWSRWLGVETPEQELDQLCNEFSLSVFDQVTKAPYIDGVINYLENCKIAGIITAINSATPTDELEDIIRVRRLGNYFNFILGSPASKSENNQQILSGLGAEPGDAIFYGDAMSDLTSALTSGITFVGVGQEIKRVLQTLDHQVFWIPDFLEIDSK